jgi:enoyl-CoA hydratase
MSVETERLGRVLVITIRRERKRNAIDASVTAGLDAALNDLEDDPVLRPLGVAVARPLTVCGTLDGTSDTH